LVESEESVRALAVTLYIAAQRRFSMWRNRACTHAADPQGSTPKGQRLHPPKKQEI
jgi:hypothetical protein